MKTLLPLVLFGIFAVSAHAQEPVSDAATAPVPEVLQAANITDLNEFLWIKRLLVVFSDSPADPRYIQQLELLDRRPEDLTERDVLVVLDSDPSADTPLRRKLRPRGFMLAVLAKDGSVVLRKPSPWDIREISRNIDKLPLRQQEIKDRREQRQATPPQVTQ